MDSSALTIAHWLAAIRIPSVGPVTFRRWLTQFSDIDALFSATTAEWQAAGITPKEIHALQNPNWAAIQRDIVWSQQSDCHLITLTDSRYPLLLRELPDSPLVLYVRGQVEQLSQPQLAIVGSRNPTISGKEMAEQFGYCLAQAGLVVTSGLALGVDAASHRGALAAGAKTIAVAGTGLNQIYPYSHRQLSIEIARQGALVSEFPPDTPPIAKNFPRRNRIISGLSLGVLVVEAALKSGSLITARCAVDQGRDVFAIPGSIHNPLARGCHQLIRQGAKLVETAEDILEELGALRQVLGSQPYEKKANTPVDLDQPHQQLFAQLGYEVTSLDAIIIQSGLTASEVSSMLLSLELRGYVSLVSGGYVRSV